MRTLFAVAMIALGAWLVPARRCPSIEWLAYDNGLHDFGYGEWRCTLRAGHSGDHYSTDHP